MNVAKPQMYHVPADTLNMVTTKLGVSVEGIEHIGFVPWDARRGYMRLCNCQGSILFAVQVFMPYLVTIRDGDGSDTFVLQGKCPVCEKIYVAETHQ